MVGMRDGHIYFSQIHLELTLPGKPQQWERTMNGKTFLEKRYNEDLELEDAIHTAILTLKESFEGQMTEDNIEVGICNEAGFRRLTPTEVKDYLAAIA